MSITTTLSTTTLATGPRVRHLERGNPDAHPVVFLHGLTDSSQSFHELFSLLPGDRYRLIALDQRGHGESERPPDGYTLDELAEDVVAFLDATGLRRASLVGHSLGSFVARRVAERTPERVRRLVLVGTAAGPANDVLRELHDFVSGMQDPVPTTFVREFQAGTTHLPLPEDFLESVVQESLKLPAATWRSAWDGMMADTVDGAPGVLDLPTLVLTGREDSVFPVADQTALAAAIGATHVVYPDTGHAVHWERPDWVARDIDAFLRT